MKIDNFKADIAYINANLPSDSPFIAIARVDSMYVGRDRVSFVYHKTRTEFGFTPRLLLACNFYTKEEAEYFLRTRLKTAVAKRNKLITAFEIIEIKAEVIKIHDI